MQKIPAVATAAPTTVATTTQSQATSTEQTVEPEKKEVIKAQETKDEEEEENEEDDEKEGIQCDTRTRCPPSTTCCFMTSSQKWGCCPLPKVSIDLQEHPTTNHFKSSYNLILCVSNS